MIYLTLQGQTDYRYTMPLFDSWTTESDAASPIAELKIVPADSNAKSEEMSSQSSQSDNEPESIVLDSDDSYIRPNQSLCSPSFVCPALLASNTITKSDIAAVFYGSHSDDLYTQIKQRNQDKGTTSKVKQLQSSTYAAASSVDSSKSHSKSGKKNQSDNACRLKGYVEEKQYRLRRTKNRLP